MFDELGNALDELRHGVELEISFELDFEGYLDRQCPQCRAHFKVMFEDWRDKVRDHQAFCPICGGSSTADQFNTEEQLFYIKGVSMAEVQRRFGDRMRQQARKSPRPSRKDGVELSWRFEQKPIALPARPPALPTETVKTKCECCGCRYGVESSGEICPSCGSVGRSPS